METARVSLDPHQRPPASIRNVYKKYQKLPKDDLHHNSEIIDSHNCDDDGTGLSLRKQLNGEVLKNLFDTFKGGPISHYPIKEVVNMYEVGDLPGKKTLVSVYRTCSINVRQQATHTEKPAETKYVSAVVLRSWIRFLNRINRVILVKRRSRWRIALLPTSSATQ